MIHLKRHIPFCGILILISLSTSMPIGKTSDTKSDNRISTMSGISMSIPLISMPLKHFYLISSKKIMPGSMITLQSENNVHPLLSLSLFGIGLFTAMAVGWIKRKSEGDVELS